VIGTRLGPPRCPTKIAVGPCRGGIFAGNLGFHPLLVLVARMSGAFDTRAASVLQNQEESKRRMSHRPQALPISLLQGGAFIALALGLTSGAQALPHCPSGMLLSQGSCCEVGSEYLPSKNKCMPVRAERRCVEGHLDECVAAGRELEDDGTSGANYAAELYRYACEEGYAPACRGLGSLYYRGIGLERDEARGRVLYEEACDGGDAVGCTSLAKLLFEEGEDLFRATELLTQACHRGDIDACDLYGRRISSDPAQFEQSAHYLERACDGGRGQACRSLVELERSHQTLNPSRESSLLERGCRAADGEACMLLGDALHRGLVTPRNDVQAALRYRAACETGHAPSCMRLAELTFVGEGVKRDVVRATELFGKACGAGVTLACERVSKLELEKVRSASREP
jgi:TPR repeat protein